MLASPWARAAEAEYPNRPVTVVIPFAAGGNGDIVLRAISTPLAQRTGQPLVIDNRPGAGGLIGSAQVARARPDGYTLLLTSNAQATSQSLVAAAPVDMADDFLAISQLATGSAILLVGANSPLRSVADLVAAARAAPDTLKYASSGIGSTPHLAMAMMARMAGIELVHIPYRGVPQAVTDLLAGRVDLAFVNSSSALTYVDNGQMHPLGVSSARRSPLTRNLPAIAESVPGFEVLNWQGLVAPRGTPRPVIDQMNAALKVALDDERTMQEFAKLGGTPSWSTPEDLAAMTRAEIDRWRAVIREANITAQ
ncbi:tripartite tricarboxylate transporter substrate-binding protein [Roseomonas sp. CAU 1739]|uniref:tripartite tricarboxylate transporter substrate-binding protein n=1 Tax=Roseomonas sp. CAU 1739 TaxID=3140364 RepID=UPI00325A88F5